MPTAVVQAEIASAIRSFRWNESEYRRLLQGPVVRDLVRRAIRVQAAAKNNARQPRPSQPGHGPSVRTGRLWGSITWRVGSDLLSPYADVGSNVYYAPYVELGTRRMAARPFLRPALQAARTT